MLLRIEHERPGKGLSSDALRLHFGDQALEEWDAECASILAPLVGTRAADAVPEKAAVGGYRGQQVNATAHDVKVVG